MPMLKYYSQLANFVKINAMRFIDDIIFHIICIEAHNHFYCKALYYKFDF